MLRPIVTAVGIAVVTCGCLDPTQIQLEVHTNVDCADVGGTTIIAGVPGAIETDPPVVASTDVCTPTTEGGDIGSLVLIPNDDDESRVGIKVVLSVGGNVDECLEPPYAGHCIVARRSLRYIPQTKLTLPVRMHEDCLGVYCDALTTCVSGTCVDAAINPEDCQGPAGCEPEGNGTGGGSPACDPPVDDVTVTWPQDDETRGHVALAVDPASCSFGMAWTESPGRLCFRQIEADGVAVAEASCEALAGDWDDVAVAPLEGGRFAVAGWSSSGLTALLNVRDPGPSNTPDLVSPVRGGALTYRDGVLVMLNEYAEWLSYRTYEGPALDFVDELTIDGATGSGSDAAFSGADLVVGWRSDPIAMVTRFLHDTGGVGVDHQTLAETQSEVVVANHAPSNVVGVTYLNTGDALELHTVRPDGSFTYGDAGNDYQLGTTNPRLAGTTGGWVMAFLLDGRALLTRYDATPMPVTTMVEAAADATSLDVAAAGNQLGVAWIDSSSALHFRLLHADLGALE